MKARMLLVVAVIAAACGGPSGPTEERRDNVRAVLLPFMTSSTLHIAAEEGYFAKHGLDVEFVRLSRTMDTMTALGRGQVDVGTGMLTITVLNMIEQGARIRLVGGLARLAPEACPFNAVVVRREHVESGAIDDPARIRALRWDADVLLPHGYWIDQMLRPHRLTIDDLDIVEMPEPATLEAIGNGSIDVAIPSEPFLSLHRASGDVAVWRPTNEIVPGYVISTMSFGRGLLDERPEVGERFATAILEAMRQLRQGKTPRNVEIVQQATGLERDRVQSACWPSPGADGRVQAASFRGFQEWAVERGLVPRVLPDEELVDGRFMDAANAALGS